MASDSNARTLTIHELFGLQQAKTPDHPAVQMDGTSLSYRELDERSSALAARLLSVSPHSAIVGISATRNIDMIVSVLAVLKSGKAYLPIDFRYPKELLQNVVADSGIDCCLGAAAEGEWIHALGVTHLDPATGDGVTGDLSPGLPGLAYVLYTSGSTGKPKGVCMGHGALVNLLTWQKANSVAGEYTRTLQFSPLGFDVSFQEIFATLTTGGTLVLISEDLRQDPLGLLRLMDEQAVNRIFLPFVALQYLTEAADAHGFYPRKLQEVITAGEQLKITPQVTAFFKALPSSVLYNHYGPTECHVVTSLKLDGDPAAWPPLPAIGQAINGVTLFLVDEQLHEVPEGTPGELCIAGVCLAEGYLNRPDLTAEKFIDWLSPQGTAIRMYRTGDLAERRPDGTVFFLGRIDDQVKISGHRVEPGEIEVLLNRVAGVQQAVVIAAESGAGGKRLLAYLSSSDGREDTAMVKAEIARALPSYMVPSAFVWIKQFPRTSSGKVDKKRLPLPATAHAATSVVVVLPSTSAEKSILAVWENLLQLTGIGVDDNFFELGGNSLLALKTVAILKKEHQYDLPITRLYQHLTARQIAAFLEGKVTARLPDRPRRRAGEQRDVAIVGMSGRFPGANSVDELWEVLKSGKDTIRFFSDEELHPSIPIAVRNSPNYVKARGVIEGPGDFDAAFFGLTPVMAEAMDPQQRIFLELCWETLERTGHLPAHYSGSIGVFAGTGNNTYYVHNVLANPAFVERAGSFQAMTVNEKDYVATRAAYQLNLQGPAVSVHTACSTSLLAIAQAVESIRVGNCDVALAGGVSITSPVNSGQLHQEGAMYSADGYTRTFDSSASGTVFSDGAGVVLLKDIEAALADGDTVFALIKGVGYNNDGGNKSSFTAPSAAGQAGAIARAFQDAGIADATDVSYIEAHGTATPLGDPIEMEGLQMAFGPTAPKQYCAIGSLKSNMGHLTAAAGVAGLIKTTLQLVHRQLVPSLHYRAANPGIDFENSPFYVNTELRPWTSDKKRLAGISSFGVGGTNVHIVLEEFEGTARPVTDPVRNWSLICWSAKSEESAQAYAGRLEDFSVRHPQVSAETVSRSLGATRMEFPSRSFAVVPSGAPLDTSAARVTSHRLRQSLDEVVFVFPGQGAQYAGMGAELYETEAVFRQAIDECAELILVHRAIDIRRVMFDESSSEGDLHQTEFTQPALFTMEYALAKLWMSWGVTPAALIGHSIGEFVAAHLAGIFSLNDALRLVITRGKLTGDLPAGSMLSVRMSTDQLEPMLPESLAIAVINSAELCVVSGPSEAIDDFATKLEGLDIPARRLNTSHAFHSPMMEAAVAPFEQLLNELSLHPPRVPLVSTVSGSWMSEATALDPLYWAEQLRRPVHFHQAVETAAEDRDRAFLEVGPGTTAFQVMRQTLAGKTSIPVPGIKSGQELHALLTAYGLLWLHGTTIQWEKLYDGRPETRVELPSYAFEKKTYWVEAAPAATRQPAATTVADEKNEYISPQIRTMRKQKLLREILSVLANASGFNLEERDQQQNFIELGFDSLLLTMVATGLKREFKVPVSFRQLNEEYNTPAKLVDYLDSILPPDAVSAPVPVTPVMSAATAPANGGLDQLTQQLQLLAQQLAEMKEQQQTPGNLTVQEAVELKKPFGATARIEKAAFELNAVQKKLIADLTARYTYKTRGSKAYTAHHRDYMADPRVVSGFKPATKEIVYPIVADRSKGSRIWDIDGNEYIDALNGFGSNFLGYQHPAVIVALHRQLDEGVEVGPQHPLAGEVCRLICEFTASDRAALCNTGSEAVLGAMRIARTVTGRSLIVSFNGSYHGINDEVIVRGASNHKSYPAAPGILPEAVQNMLVLEYGTPESLEIIRSRASEFAAVLVEPVQSRRPDFVPVEFLNELRKITRQAGTVLIFDEVITGFRMHPGGAQAMFGIRADIGTYGKVVASGIPIGVIAGRKEFMDALDGGTWKFGDASAPEAGVTYFAGTFVRHPLALAAAKASLDYMRLKGPELQEAVSAKTKRLVDALSAICQSMSLPITVPSFGSLWKLKFTRDIPFGELLFTLMRDKGIHIQDVFPCFLTEAHTEADVDAIIAAFRSSVNELIQGQFLEGEVVTPPVVKSAGLNEPPVPGARLGRDPDGNPAWYVPDPAHPGRYLPVS